MAIIQKTIELSVRITIEVNEDLIGTEGVDDPFNMAQTVHYGLDYLNESGDLFQGGKVRECSADVVRVENTYFQYD